jgi:hypothetical protein
MSTAVTARSRANTCAHGDITELYVARHGVPKTGTAIWIRTCQHIDVWTDVPKVTRARVPAAAA